MRKLDLTLKKMETELCHMRKANLFISTCLILFLSATCMERNDELCNDPTPVGSDITSLLADDLNCELIKQTDQDQVTFKITSQGELEEWLTCQPPLTDIDFENELIVGGQVKSYECGQFYELISEKECNEIKIRVSILPRICGAITDVFFFASLPLENLNTDMEYEFNYLEP